MLRRNIGMALAVAMLLSVGFAAKAADDATGKWSWEFKRQNGDPVKVTLTLKQDGEKLTGSITGRENTQTEISDGKVKDGEVSFKVTRKRDDKEYVSAYTGKISGDTITGKTEMTGGDQKRSRDWEAKRVKE